MTASALRKTKIICTMGPNLFEKGLVRQLMLSGMDVARFNFSHDTHENHLKRFTEVCRLRDELGLPVATMLDTKGPEIRLGDFADSRVTLDAGQLFTLTTDDILGDQTRVSITYKNLPNDVKPGNTILIDDGLVGMTVEHISGGDICCRVLNSGVISNHKGVNVPNVHLTMPFISEKDRADLLFAAEHGFDFIAASFTRSADDVMQIRHVLQEAHAPQIRIVAKIENAEGVQNADEIFRAADAIMVARGDMGVEIPLEEVPGLQKALIKMGQVVGKPVITATQMLDSMMKNPRPTRAEATDVANAIYDGTSAIMLSGETAAGAYPVEAVETMVRIAKKTEADINYVSRFAHLSSSSSPDVTSAISHATVTSAHDLKATAIITVTKSGKTARVISKYRPNCPIISCTSSRVVWRQLSLSWGVFPLMIEEKSSTDDLFETAVEAAVHAGMIRDGELAVLTAGVPLGVSGTTNLMTVHVVGHLLVQGKGISGHQATGALYVLKNEHDTLDNMKNGDILVCHQTTRAMLPVVRKASGLILEDDDPEGHGAIAGISLDIPVIIGAEGATSILTSGAVITMDGDKGTVSSN